MRELIGRAFNRYQIASMLDEGGMGTVYQARDLSLQRDVAIKILHTNLARKPDFQGRFLLEARTAARLDHPSIVPVYDFGQAHGFYYLVMELIEGENLFTWLDRRRKVAQRPQLSTALTITRQLCLAVDYAHRQGVLHRDIKPANILLKPRESNGLPFLPVLTDFGLATLDDGPQPAPAGTLPYMAPEQASRNAADQRSDVYALGILLQELSSGVIQSATDPFHQPNDAGFGPPARPCLNLSQLASGLERAILKATHSDPAARYASAAELFIALKEIDPSQEILRISGSPQAKGRDDEIDLRRPGGPSRWLSNRPANRQRIAARVSRTAISAEPGQQEFTQVTVYNRGPAADHFTLSVQGIHPEWVTSDPVERRVPPGGEGTFNIFCHPPRKVESRAGLYPFTLRIASQKRAYMSASIKMELSIREFTRFEAWLQPGILERGQTARVSVTNQGNATARYKLVWRDRQSSLVFLPSQAELEIPGGQTSTAEFNARPHQVPYFWQATLHPFQIIIIENNQKCLTLTGELLSRGVFARLWSLIMLLALFLVLAAGPP